MFPSKGKREWSLESSSDPHTAQSLRAQGGTRSTANAPEAPRSIENAPGAQRSRENAPGAQDASPEQRTLWEQQAP